MTDSLSNVLSEVIERITSLRNDCGKVIVVIDGRAASGKSTAAEHLAELFGGSVIHADDFFLPFDMRSTERLSEPGGNVHYERLYDEVISHLRSDDCLAYGVFDCSAGRVTSVRHVNTDGVVIIEGAYSLHPRFGRYYDLSVFMTAPRDVRLERVLARSNAEKAAVFADKWMPMEERYINAFDIQSSADILVSTDDKL